jgi:hypothetical protein
MLEMVQVRIATGVTRVVWTAVVMRCGKQMEKLPHYHFSWIVSFQKQRYNVCEILGDRRGYSHLKEEALDRIKWRNRFGGGCGPVVWQITDDDDDRSRTGALRVYSSICGDKCKVFLLYTQATYNADCLSLPLSKRQAHVLKLSNPAAFNRIRTLISHKIKKNDVYVCVRVCARVRTLKISVIDTDPSE